MRIASLRGMIALAALAAAGTVTAQNPRPGTQPPPNAVRPFGGAGFGSPLQQQRRAQLRMEIAQRFAARVQTELGLSDDQMGRLRQAEQASQERRRTLNEREQALRQAVEDQLQPGVAASPDSLDQLMNEIAANHIARAQEEQQELHDLSQFLTPVQTARLLRMRQQLMQRIQAIRENRFRPQGGVGGPGDPEQLFD